MRKAKYLLSFISPIMIIISFTLGSYWSYLGIFYGAVIIPILELTLKPDLENLSAIEAQLAEKDKWYDLILYLFVPLQYFILFLAMYQISRPEREWYEIIGMILTLSGACGNFGINIAHELGHRRHPLEQLGAKALLLTSLYLHFFIEHNQGHHKFAATKEDTASAKYGETLQSFCFRSITTGYISAWKIERKRLRRKQESFLSIYNQMLWFTFIQSVFITLIITVFGVIAGLSFLSAAFMGILMLETINYIQHYGLSRKKVNKHRYEPTSEAHSWDCHSPISRIVLFELGRHADHHKYPAKKYPIFNSNDVSPQMPTGYVGMMLLAQIPPLWFKVMHKQLALYQSKN